MKRSGIDGRSGSRFNYRAMRRRGSSLQSKRVAYLSTDQDESSTEANKKPRYNTDAAPVIFDDDQEAAACCSQVRVDIYGGELSSEVHQMANSEKTTTKNSDSPNHLSADVTKSSDCYRLIQNTSPYLGWLLYFPCEKFIENGIHQKLIELCRQFIADNCIVDLDDILKNRYFLIDQDQCINFVAKNELEGNVIDNIDLLIRCMGLAMHNRVSEFLHENENESEGSKREPRIFPSIQARFRNCHDTKTVKSLQFSQTNKFVTIRGIVNRVSSVRPKCLRMAFQCQNCHGEIILVLPDDGNFILPNRCSDLECRGKNFIPQLCSTNTQTIDCQKIRLRDSFDEEEISDCIGEPAVLECEMTGLDLMDQCRPGSVVLVSGFLKLQPVSDLSKRFKTQSSYSLCLHVNCLQLEKENSLRNEMHLSKIDIIDFVRKSPHPFGLLINSLCPYIFGHQFVKAGLLLALAGAGDYRSIQEPSDNQSILSTPTRDSVHVLLIGDPGLGKTHLLQACKAVSPRGIFLSGHTTTVAGLTVALTRDNTGGSSNDFSIEAGALILADNGVCCIDEFDKMSPQHHNALLEAMEQQQVSIAKCGAHCQFPARTSIIAAANPIGGRYEGRNLERRDSSTRFSQALMNRFDLIYTLHDSQDSHRDKQITEHIMQVRNQTVDQENGGISIDTAGRSILTRDSLRQYFHMLKQQPVPRISHEAAKILLNRFDLARQQSSEQDGDLAVGIRQFESLIRLTQARARCDFAEICTENHALDVVDILEFSMGGKNNLEMPNFPERNPVDSKRRPKKLSQKERLELFVDLLKKTVRLKRNNIFDLKELKQLADDLFVNETQYFNFDDFLHQLNQASFILKKGNGCFQLL